ncbi:MAG: TAXI family TRAP transporter solute-binding subunit [Janthinobacterium lividum]
MMKKIFRHLLLLYLVHQPLARAAAEFKIVTASERGTYIQIGRDLAKLVAPGADIDLEVLPSKGSADNVQLLRNEPGVKFALVQSDVYQAMLDQAAAGNAAAGRIIRPLRLIMPLYNEEIYFVTRADSPLTHIQDIKDKKIAVGPVGSGTALSATTLYRLMFNEPMKEANTTYVSNEEALIKLTTDKSVDVVVIVAGQPAKLFVDMKPEARQFIKLLSFEPGAKESVRAATTYFPATIRAASYPNWIEKDVPTLTVKAFLVTYDYNLDSTRKYLASFANSLCSNFDTLQAEGHPKWKEVKMELPQLGRGWSYYPSIEKVLRRCVAARTQTMAAGSVAGSTVRTRPCTQQEKVLGLCS